MLTPDTGLYGDALRAPGGGASRRVAYTEQAGSYDRRTRQYQYWRKRIVDLLPLTRGGVVLDVGCGTGLCLPMLQQRVGPEGAVIGIDQSPEMLAVARRRIVHHGWRNVTLIESTIEDAEIPMIADAVLFCAVHDILRSRRALENVFAHVLPGGWVSAGGGKWAPPWMVGVNMLVAATHEPFVTSFDGFEEPTRLLREFVDELKVVDVTGGYIAVGQACARVRTSVSAAIPS